MFIKVGDIKGEAGDSKHKDEIDVLSWSWGMTQSGTTHKGGGGGSGKVNVKDLSFTKNVDKASPNLMMACSKGKHYPSALLTVRKAGENPVEYVKITMENVLITSVDAGGDKNQETLTEDVTLNFSKVKTEYTPQGDDGAPEAAVVYGWNIKENVSW
jgi:type VI secretion system secreted protein Hcp